jgi:hypothetical protein
MFFNPLFHNDHKPVTLSLNFRQRRMSFVVRKKLKLEKESLEHQMELMTSTL